jgi:hypothetical protein
MVVLIFLVGGLGWWLMGHWPESEFLPQDFGEVVVDQPTDLGDQEVEEGVNSSAGSSASLAPQKAFFLEVSSPADGSTVRMAAVEVKGRTLPGAEVYVNEHLVNPDKNGNFSVKIDLYEGENPILVVAGNEQGDAEKEITVFYELE